MKLANINKIFRKIATIQIQYRWIFLAGLLIFTIVGALGLTKIKIESSNSAWFGEDEKIEIEQRNFEENFGSSEIVGILVEADDVFAPEVLNMINDLSEELILNVPYADKVMSLTELEISIGTDEGMEIINPFGNGIPTDPQELEKLRNLILNQKSIVNKLVSKDSTETWITLSLIEPPSQSEWAKTTGEDPMYEIGKGAINVLTDPKWESNAYTIKAAGMPYIETEALEFIEKESIRILIVTFIVMIVMLVIFLRSFRGIIVPVISTGAGVAVVFGFMGWFSIGVQILMVILPVILGVALAVGYSVHIVNSFKSLYINGLIRKQAAIGAIENTGWPILFTVLTTMGSMISFAVVNMRPVRWMGIACTAVVLSVFIYVIILVPILFSFGKKYYSSKKLKNTTQIKSDTFFKNLGNNVLKQKIPIIIASILITVIAIPGILKISVNMDNFKFMGIKIPYMKRIHSVVNSQLGSYVNYNITVYFDEQDSIKEPNILKNFDTLLNHVGKFEFTKKTAGVPKIFSIIDILKGMNKTMHANDNSYYTIPDSKSMIAQLLFLYEISGGTQSFQWIDNNYSTLRAQVEVPQFNAKTIAKDIEEIQKIGEELFPNAKTVIVGAAVRFADMNSRIVWAELKSFLIAFIIILILLALVFSSAKTGLIGIIPNIAPVIVIGGVMGYANFQLDLMTMIIMPMILGIAVDDTIHFTSKIKYEFEKYGNYKKAIIDSFAEIGRTLAMTTVILSVSFSTYLLSPINTWVHLGILAPIGLLTALIADYTITPVMIMITHPFGKEKK